MPIKPFEFDDTLSIGITSTTAVYVSKKGKLESLDALGDTGGEYRGDDPKHEEQNAEVLKKLATETKGKYDKPVLINCVDASHYGYMNGNYSYYNPKFMGENSKTFTTPFRKPVTKNHSDDQDDVIGRIIKADPVHYKLKKEEAADIKKPQGHVKVYSVITDREAIDKIMDQRMLSVSIRSSSTPSEVRCSVCGKTPYPFGDECDHQRGKEYEDADGVKKVAFHIVDRQWYKEYSFIPHPADMHAKSTQYVMVNADNQKDWIDHEDDLKIIRPKISLYVGGEDKTDKWGFSRNKIINLKGDEVNITDVLGETMACVDDICRIVKPGNNDSAATGTQSVTPEMSDNENKEGDSMPKCNECPDVLMADYATLNIMESMLSNKMFNTVDEVMGELRSVEHFDWKELKDEDKTLENLLAVVSDKLDYLEDALLSTAKRKKLPERTFCGPGKSFPVPDCAHVTAARRLIGKANQSSATKASIMSCVNRKASRMGCDGGKESTKPATEDANRTPNPTEDTMDPITFKTKDEILGSSIVTAYVDRINAEHEEKVHSLQAKLDALEGKIKAEMVDQIVSKSIELKLSRVKNYLDAATDEAKNAALKTVKDSLMTKSVEVLDEIIAVVEDSALQIPKAPAKDPISEKLDSATAAPLPTTPAPATAPAAAPATPENKDASKDQAPPASTAVDVNNPPPPAAAAPSNADSVTSIMDLISSKKK